MKYNAKNYWEKRLSEGFDLSRVGHISFSKHYNNFLYKAKLRALKKALLLHGIEIFHKTVCDIGCGTGFFVNFYHSKKAKSITGFDITAISIGNLKRKYPNYRFFQKDISSSSLMLNASQKFDILNVFDVLYHITDDKAFGQALANISSLSGANGFIFITDSFGSQDMDIASHVKLRSKDIYEDILKMNNVRIVGVYPLYCFLNRLIFGKFKNRVLRKVGLLIDNFLAPIYYILDGMFLSEKNSNLNLVVLRKEFNR
ncbi:class I SAM-dependent methyltransferase [bacterium]|nr:class I SAM-dependent methyltransferase [bacterium]